MTKPPQKPDISKPLKNEVKKDQGAFERKWGFDKKDAGKSKPPPTPGQKPKN